MLIIGTDCALIVADLVAQAIKPILQDCDLGERVADTGLQERVHFFGKVLGASLFELHPGGERLRKLAGSVRHNDTHISDPIGIALLQYLLFALASFAAGRMRKRVKNAAGPVPDNSVSLGYSLQFMYNKKAKGQGPWV